MQSKLWVIRQVDPIQRGFLSQALSISPATASLLLNRGVTNLDQANAWMSPIQTHDPFLIPDMERAVDRLHHAMQRREQVCFYGDYDVDGMSATSIYLSFFRTLGANVRAYVPHRLREGYGLNESAVRTLAREGVSLLVTSDCGTTSHHEISLANELGLDVIVTDHHQTDTDMPPAFAVMNPHRQGAQYPFHGLCSGGLAYKVAQAYEAKYGPGSVPLESLLDLVALATIADIVPLQDENRLLVREGLTQISRGARCGIRALKHVAGITRECTAETIAFKLGPRLNAAGRLDEAIKGVTLLTTESEREANALAEELDRLNQVRRELEGTILEEAVAQAERQKLSGGIVLYARGWHLGVVGIVAARIMERFHRPTVVIAVNEDGIGKGSARTVPGFDLYQALAGCRDLLVAFGGHPSAAGVTIQESQLPVFSDRFSTIAEKWIQDTQSTPILHVDSEVRLSEITLSLLREIKTLHPFGAGNPEPTFVVKGLNVINARVVGDKHLKMTVRQGGSSPFDSIGFGMKSLQDHGLSPNAPIDVACTPELNHWNGYDRIQLRIRDIRAAGCE
ncbi:MAG: single-stranded-DNA-specific exonuclease RecJ [Nitrospira sp.]|nr:single-stranded-DNA-specific exonuclease RecJ [Nitrospira sp.]MDH4369173.1 single-stranded-DNA-specific exonuclease RecJ [Nitrospira sp.]MDH5347901.1 single-stranded-DNA-specific exonuclease RecJ [Nitrospira sp.]MDH5497492.1 single-stranded-DNA-specific exonuclease RecJ [Nitrospira sp.]MDH5724235.1 single-stranded-DNA-specific exonuclease RecJ [Nitrospira sp.]